MRQAAAIRLTLAAVAGLGLNLALFEAFARLPVAVAVAASAGFGGGRARPGSYSSMREPTIRTAPVAVGGHRLPAARRPRRSASGCMLMIPRHPGAGTRHLPRPAPARSSPRRPRTEP